MLESERNIRLNLPKGWRDTNQEKMENNVSACISRIRQMAAHVCAQTRLDA